MWYLGLGHWNLEREWLQWCRVQYTWRNLNNHEAAWLISTKSLAITMLNEAQGTPGSMEGVGVQWGMQQQQQQHPHHGSNNNNDCNGEGVQHASYAQRAEGRDSLQPSSPKGRGFPVSRPTLFQSPSPLHHSPASCTWACPMLRVDFWFCFWFTYQNN